MSLKIASSEKRILFSDAQADNSGGGGWGLGSSNKKLYRWIEIRFYWGSVGIGYYIDMKRPAWAVPLIKALSGGSWKLLRGLEELEHFLP